MQVDSGHRNQILLRLDRLCNDLENYCILFYEAILGLWRLTMVRGCYISHKSSHITFSNFHRRFFFD